ncbi:MAG: hypothetical protein BroJett021_46830 [Chloroflexota bacterium]|nr:MAG: hypothetical protein BroJett021_46830 [Chloroflexota bacterium]
MKVYLDNCCLQRPLDDKSQLRVQIESEAVLAVLSLHEQRQIELISSEVLEFEVEQNPDRLRRTYVLEVLAQAAMVVRVDEAIHMRAREFEFHGIRGMDALHLACAEAAGATYFCLCDDRLLRKVRMFSSVRVKVVSLLELVEELMK